MGLLDPVRERAWRAGIRHTVGTYRKMAERRREEMRDLLERADLNRQRRIELWVAMLAIDQLDNPWFKQPVEKFRFRFVDGKFADLYEGEEPDVVIATDTIGAIALRTGYMESDGERRPIDPVHLWASGRIVSPIRGKAATLRDYLLIQEHYAEIRKRLGR